MDKQFLNDPEALKKIFDEQAAETCRLMNADIDRCGGAFHLRDNKGHNFYFSEIASGGFPMYRGDRGSKVIFGTGGYEVVEKYATP